MVSGMPMRAETECIEIEGGGAMRVSRQVVVGANSLAKVSELTPTTTCS